MVGRARGGATIWPRNPTHYRSPIRVHGSWELAGIERVVRRRVPADAVDEVVQGGVARLHWGGDPTGWASFSRLGSDHRVQSDPAMAPGSVCRPRHHDASVRCARTHRLTGQAALYNIQTGNKPNARPIEDRLPRLDAPSFVSSLVTPCRWIGRSSVDRVRQLAGFSCVFSEIRGHVGGHGVSDTASARFETQDSLSKVLGLAGPTSRQG